MNVYLLLFDVFEYYNIRSPCIKPQHNFSKTNYGTLLRYLHNANWFHFFHKKVFMKYGKFLRKLYLMSLNYTCPKIIHKIKDIKIAFPSILK